MVSYLARKYYTHSVIIFIGFTILPYLRNGGFSYLFPRAVFLGGVAALIYTWYDFRKRSLWPLYDNLRYPKFLLLSGMFLSLQLIPIIVNLLI